MHNWFIKKTAIHDWLLKYKKKIIKIYIYIYIYFRFNDYSYTINDYSYTINVSYKTFLLNNLK